MKYVKGLEPYYASGNTNETELEIFDASEAQANANADLFKVKDSTMPWQRHVSRRGLNWKKKVVS